MAKKFVLYSLALVNLAITYFTAMAVAAIPEHSIYYNDSLWILAAFVLGITLVIFAPIWIAAALILVAHDAF